MEVSVSNLRAELKTWIERAGEGEDIVITERGVPVARLSGVASAGLIADLERDGLLTAPDGERPVAAHRERPDAKSSANPVSGLVRRLRR